MSRACGETIGPRIRTCRFVAASGRCSGSNRPDQHNGSCPFMPQSRTRSTSNAISFLAIRSALSEAKRFRIGGRRLRPEQEPSPSTLVRPEPSSRDNPLGGVLCSLEYIARGRRTRYMLRTLDSKVHPSCIHGLKHFSGRSAVALRDTELLERFRPPCTRDCKSLHVEIQDFTQLLRDFIRGDHRTKLDGTLP